MPPRVAIGVLVGLVVLVAGGLWVRDSPLVAVDHVEVTGARGADAPRIRQAIADAAQDMTTLHADPSRLMDALRPYPIVAGLQVHRELPHTLKVVVREHVAVAALVEGGRALAVAADGTILPNQLTAHLPVVPVASPPGGRRVVERRARRLVALLGAAPGSLRGRVADVGLGPHGLTARLRKGPQLYFGPGSRLRAKWLAAARVLADRSSAGASYVELRVPERPAAGGLVTASTPPQAQPPIEPVP